MASLKQVACIGRIPKVWRRLYLPKQRRHRSTLSKAEAQRRYLEIGSLAALEQIRLDSEALDEKAIAIGPFGRLDAEMVAARDHKTRGAITNLFGSQAAYQIATMDLVLDAGAWAEAVESPAPQDFATPDDWLDALFTWLSARGPQHGADPKLNYAALWALWLGAVPYGLWSERVAKPSMEEYERWVGQLEEIFREALAHFGLMLRDGVTLADLAGGTASLTEGVWLNQCLTRTRPGRPDEPISAALVCAGRLLWKGALAS
jgi:hypothetical protein